MKSTNILLALALFCMTPLYSMDNSAVSIKYETELRDVLENTKVGGRSISFADYLSEQNKLSKDVLNEIACKTKDSVIETKNEYTKLNTTIEDHIAGVKRYRSLSRTFWRFITRSKEKFKFEVDLKLSLTQEQLFWSTVYRVSKQLKQIDSTAVPNYNWLQDLTQTIKKDHLPYIQEKQQTEHSVEYTLPPDKCLKLPNTHTSPFVNQKKAQNARPFNNTSHNDASMLPGIHCWNKDNDMCLFNSINQQTAYVRNCKAEQFDLSDRYFAASESDGKKQLKVYALSTNSKPQYIISSQDSNYMKVVPPEIVEVEKPYWTKTLQHECTALALWQDRPLFAYSTPCGNGHEITLTQFPTALPAAKSRIARLFAKLKFWVKGPSCLNWSVKIEADSPIKKIIPLLEENFLCLAENGTIYKVTKTTDTTNGKNEKLKATFLSLPFKCADIAVDHHTNLIVFSNYSPSLKKTSIWIADKSSDSINVKTEQSHDIFSDPAPKIQCYKGNIFVWYPKTKGNNVGMCSTTYETVPDQYSNVESIKTGFCSTKSVPVDKTGDKDEDK